MPPSLRQSRGLYVRCPAQVAARLRAAGWVSSKGYWKPASDAQRALRWWDALPMVMAPARRRLPEPVAHDLPEAAPRCHHTHDLFVEASP